MDPTELNREPVRIDPEVIRSFTREGQFVGVAVELAKETASFIVIAGGSGHPSAADAETLAPWPRDKAILIGQFVRLYKLFNGLMTEACKDRLELAFIYVRLIFETAVNVRSAVGPGGAAFCDSYVRSSLATEKELQERIEDNVAARGGEILPIEARMLKGIAASFRLAGVDAASVAAGQDGRRVQSGLYKRACKVGWKDLYFGLVSIASHSVHGTWDELRRYHLQEVKGGFRAAFEWGVTRPQIVAVASFVALHAVRDFLTTEFGDDARDQAAQIDDCLRRWQEFSELHEEFLTPDGIAT